MTFGYNADLIGNFSLNEIRDDASKLLGNLRDEHDDGDKPGVSATFTLPVNWTEPRTDFTTPHHLRLSQSWRYRGEEGLTQSQ